MQLRRNRAVRSTRLVRLERVALVAASCVLDLDSNLNSAHEEYMAGKIPRGAYEYVLARHGALLVALHDAGFTGKHPIFEFPIKPNAAGEPQSPPKNH